MIELLQKPGVKNILYFIAAMICFIIYAKSVGEQDEVKVRVIDDITKKVVWVR
jgi:hypothetical protein